MSPRRGAIPRIALALSVALAGCTTPESLDTWTGQGTLVIEGATVFTSPGVEPIQNAIVIVMDGIIEAVGPVGELPVPPPDLWIDGSGLSVLSGFWNAHVRMDEELLAAAGSAGTDELLILIQDRFTRFGFTSVVDTATPTDQLSTLIGRIQSGEVMGPRILSAPASGPGGITPGANAGIRLPDASDPRWPVDLLDSLAAEGVAVVTGADFLRDARNRAAESGVGGAVAPEEDAVASLKTFVDLGGRLIFGTGAGYNPRYDPMSEHLLLEEGAIPFASRLASLTTEPAVRFGYEYVGGVWPGMVADLVLVEGDPEVDVTAFGRVRLVLREGRPLFW